MASRADKKAYRSVGIRLVSLNAKYRAKKLAATKRTAEAVLRAGGPMRSTPEQDANVQDKAHKLMDLCDGFTPEDGSAGAGTLAILADFWARRERRDGGPLSPFDCWHFAMQVRNVFAGMSGPAWEAQVLDALGQNPNLTLAEAAKIGGVSKSTISRHLFLGRIWARDKSTGAHGSQIYDHDGATEDPDPRD